MNAFDGVLTSLGIIISNFALLLAGQIVPSKSILITGYATTIAIGISGLAGAFLAETAELRRSNLEIKEAMAVFIHDNPRFGVTNEIHLKEEDYYPKVDLEGQKLNTINGEEIEPINIDPVPIKKPSGTKPLRKKLRFKFRKREKKEEKSLSEKAESFSSIIAAIIDGFSPALGSIFGFVPFFFVINTEPVTSIYVVIYSISLFIEVSILFTLGTYLAKISEDKIWLYGLSMVATGVLTSFIGYLITLIATGGL
jgi:predicted membrane protein (TIGR00267 family)